PPASPSAKERPGCTPGLPELPQAHLPGGSGRRATTSPPEGVGGGLRDDVGDDRPRRPPAGTIESGHGPRVRLRVLGLLRPRRRRGYNNELPNPVIERSDGLHHRRVVRYRRTSGAGQVPLLDPALGELVVARDRFSERRVAGQVLDQVEQEPPAAPAPELAEVPATPEREVGFDRLAVAFDQPGEAAASPRLGWP